MFQIKFPTSMILDWANRYPAQDDFQVEFEVAPAARERGWLTKDELVALCAWKTPRSKPRVASNEPEFVEELTRSALSTCSERLRIEALTLLCGVSYPTASVVLHFCHKERYPILDFRALWSLGIETPPADYTFAFWWEYVLFCRRLADEAQVSMRVLDRALWQYSKEKQ